MKFQGITGNFAEANVDALAVAIFKGEKVTSVELKDLDKLTGGLISAVIKAEEFKGHRTGGGGLRRGAPRLPAPTLPAGKSCRRQDNFAAPAR